MVLVLIVLELSEELRDGLTISVDPIEWYDSDDDLALGIAICDLSFDALVLRRDDWSVGLER